MRLKRLELIGYKSFANRTEFVFDTGVTAIVGPNGSGKSNVADALRWVLGETNVRHLRGKKSEDLIFAGSDGRSQFGMAQVTLTLDNSAGWYAPNGRHTGNGKLKSQAHNGHAEGSSQVENGNGQARAKFAAALLETAPAEISIVRRLYRDGSTEYLINGQKARLADVTHVLALGGVAGETFAVIGQGMVDQALALRPEDRRQMLDEAAGIKPLQAQRDRALNRLDEAKANLLRVNDILSELTPQLRRLERQAARAVEAQRVSTELETVLTTWYGYQWRVAQARAAEARQALTEREQVAGEWSIRVTQLLERVETQRRQRDQHRTTLEGLRRQAGRLRDAAEGVRRDLAVTEERVRNLTGRQTELTGEAQAVGETLQRATAALAEAQAAFDRARGEAETASVTFTRLQAEAETARAEAQRHQQALDAARKAAQQAAAQAADRRTRAATLSDRRDDAERAAREAEQAHVQHRAQAQAARARLAETDAALAAATATRVQQEQLVAEARKALQTAQSAVEAAQSAVDQAREAQRAAAHHRATLAQVRRAALGPAVQTLLDQRHLTGLLGPLAEYLIVPPDLDRVVAAALGPQLHGVVVKTWDDARRAIAFLTQRDLGLVTFFILETGDRRLATGDSASAISNPQSPVANLQSLVSLISARPGYEALVRRALRDIMLVGSVEEGIAVLSSGVDNPCLRLVTPNGNLISATGTLTGGALSWMSILETERDWAALPDPARLQQAVQAAQAEVERRRLDVNASRGRLAEAETALARLVQEREGARVAHAQAEAAVERAVTAEGWHQRNWQRQRDEAQRLALQAASLAVEAETAEAHQAEADARVAAIAARPLPDLTDIQTRLSQAQSDAAIARQAQQTAGRLVDQSRAEHAQAERQARERAQRVAQINSEIEVAQTRAAQLKADSERLAGERAALRGRMDPVEVGLAALEQELRALDTDLAAARDASHKAERVLTQAEAHAREAEEGLRRLASEIEADLNLLPRLPDTIPHQMRLAFDGEAELPAIPTLPEGAEERLTSLKAQLRRLGTPDPDALTEYQLLGERHAFLTTQMADLEKAIGDLRTVVTELESAMTTRFDEVFGQVAGRFSRNFAALFGGGTAKLVATDSGGLEIIARPPGKRLQPLSLLSGGERALTASALIFALLEVSGAPFVFLDEVDAALDEANVGRFRTALERLADRTQIVLITHNRGTIEAADAVYGITMAGTGISQAISLRLDRLDNRAAIA